MDLASIKAYVTANYPGGWDAATPDSWCQDVVTWFDLRTESGKVSMEEIYVRMEKLGVMDDVESTANLSDASVIGKVCRQINRLRQTPNAQVDLLDPVASAGLGVLASSTALPSFTTAVRDELQGMCANLLPRFTVLGDEHIEAGHLQKAGLL